MTSRQTILVGLDFSECGHRALMHALSMARGHDTIVHIAHAVTRDDLGAGRKIEQQEHALEDLPWVIWKRVFKALRELDMGYEDVPVSLHVRLGDPVEVIRQVAIDYEADLVVVGTHGRTGMRKLMLGSVAEKLVRDGHFPVLVAHENKLHELQKTIFPDAPLPPDRVEMSANRARPHIYRSTLISAWNAFGRPTSPSL